MKKLLILFTVFLFAGCATNVSVDVERPAELNLNGARKISVLPVKIDSDYSSSSSHAVSNGWDFFWSIAESVAETIAESNGSKKKKSDLSSCALIFENELKASLVNTKYFSVIDSNLVAEAIKNKNEIPCDVYLSSSIVGINYTTDERKTEKKVNNKKTVVKEYQKAVQACLCWDLADSQGVIIYSDKKNISYTSSWEENAKSCGSSSDLLQKALRNETSRIVNKLAPHYEKREVKLLKVKSKDERVKMAGKLAKEKMLEKSAAYYFEYYKFSDDFASGYNAALLYMQMEKLSEARNLMNELVERTADKKAIDALRNIDREIELRDKLENQNRARDSKNREAI